MRQDLNYSLIKSYINFKNKKKMFDDEIDNDYQNQRKRSIRKKEAC